MSIAVLIEAAEFLERRERGDYLYSHFFRSPTKAKKKVVSNKTSL